jgi:hypothetical protein
MEEDGALDEGAVLVFSRSMRISAVWRDFRRRAVARFAPGVNGG